MSKTLTKLLLLTAVFTMSLLAAGALLAEECPRGDLDSRFCDRDGDMVADPPTDPSKWLNPDTLYFAYTPVDDAEVHKTAWADFMTHMEKVTDKKVKYFIIQSNAVQIQAMRAERLHVATFNTGSVPLAVNCAGFVPFSTVSKQNGTFGYEMEIITYPTSGIKKVEDIKGRKLTFTSHHSNSGFKAPSAILKAEFNMIPERDYEPVFSGKHSNSILGVANRDYETAAIGSPIMDRMISRNVIKAEDVEKIYKSQTFPVSAQGYIYNLHPDLAQKIRQAYANFEWYRPDGTPTSLKVLYENYSKFKRMSYKEHFSVIRTIDKANSVSYDCK